MTDRPEDDQGDSGIPSSRGEILFFQTEDGGTRIECRFEEETIWLSQALIAELYQKDVRTVNEHLKNIFEEGELDPGATIRKFRIVRRRGRPASGSRDRPLCAGRDPGRRLSRPQSARHAVPAVGDERPCASTWSRASSWTTSG